MNQPRAFTVVELLVTVGVIGLLLAITVPALSGSRTATESVECLHTLRQIGVAYGAYDADYDMTMPTLFDRAQTGPINIPSWGGNGFTINPADQVWFWAYPLRTYVDDAPQRASSRQASRAFSTPLVDRTTDLSWSADAEGEGNDYELTAYYAAYSYLHCPTLFTAPRAWMSAQSPSLNARSEPIKAAAIRAPSDKTNLITVRTFYAANAPIQHADPNDHANWLACDGHAESLMIGTLHRGLPFMGGFVETHVELGAPYPGIGTRAGIEGRDR